MLTSYPKIAVIIVAAGSSTRFNSSIPKPYSQLLGKTFLENVIDVFYNNSKIHSILTVVAGKDINLYSTATESYNNKLLPFVLGGDSRAKSVVNGLLALENLNFDYVLIHDAARIVHNADLNSIIDVLITENLTSKSAVVLGSPVVDTIKQIHNNKILNTIDRNNLFKAFTPQAFPYKTILELHKKYKDSNLTDDSALFELDSLNVIKLEVLYSYPKLTTKTDKEIIEFMLNAKFENRVGQGVDFHQLTTGSGIWLGGVLIPCNYSVVAHSDGDVILHALTDAILGSISAGDIGVHFPPTDIQWKDKESIHFLKHAFSLLKNRGGYIVNADVSVMLENPKVSKYYNQMKSIIAEALEISTDDISIKATTTEKLGFIGRGEGLAANAIVSVSIPKKA